MNPTYIERLTAYLQIVSIDFLKWNEATLTFRPSPEKWSKKEILGHLIDSARMNLQRFLEVQYSPSPYVLRPYSQSDLVRINDYQNLQTRDVVQFWKSLNQQIKTVFQKIDEEELAKPIDIPHEGKSTDLRFLMEDYVDHLEHHLKQIFGAEVLADRVATYGLAGGKWNYSVAEALNLLEKEEEKRFTTLFRHGTMYIEIYQPKDVDLQQPHEQDELYVVISGKGDFYNNGVTKPFQTGDVLFVPAGIEHRFENFSDDFKTWVIFYGAMGGEQKQFEFFEIQKEIEGEVYTISTDHNKINAEAAHQFLTHSYWAKGRALETMKKAISGCLTFGLYYKNKQIGLARIMTDFATMAYLSDVYVLEEFRGKGVGKWLTETVVQYEPLAEIKNFMLHTKDAHGLYEQFDFELATKPEMIMQKKREWNI